MAMSNDEFKEAVQRWRNLLEEATNYNDEITAQSASRSRREVKQAKERLSELDKQLTKGDILKNQYDVLYGLAKKQISALQGQNQVLGRIKQELKITVNSVKDFLQNTAVQYNYAQMMAKEYKSISREMGLSSTMSEYVTQNFKDASGEVLMMGGELTDLTKMMTTFAEDSGRIRMLDKEDLEIIESIALGTNMTAGEAASMAQQFDLMGVSAEKMNESLAAVFKESQAIGLNSNKVIKVLQKEMGKMQTYSFASGVRGMTEMAKQAVKMRLDVGDVLQMADKFYQPEAAIEAAANLQMLGGDIAKAFGDPFETMYLARNKPEELAKKLGDMTENMMQFNEETGEYEFPAEVRMQLKSAGEQLGINVDKMIEMSRQTSKIKDLKMKFTSIGDEDMQEGLASLAKFSEDRGEFVIQHKTADGTFEELGLDQIGPGLAEELLQANEMEGKSDSDLFKNIAISTQTLTEQQESLNKSLMARVAGETNIYEHVAKNFEDTVMKDLKDNLNDMVSKFTESANFKDMFSGDLGIKDVYGEVMDEISKTVDLAKDGMKDFGDNLGKLTEVIEREAKKIRDREGHDLVSFPGSEGRVLTGPFGSISLDDRDLIMALDPNKVSEERSTGKSSTIDVGGTATINVNINSNTAISPYMESQLTSKIIEVYQKIANGNGDVSSVYQGQPSKGSDILYA
tara:strand:+ start:5286 stop:7343 length:2058 start_codon:yes stop_codon:yes gene_type:complete